MNDFSSVPYDIKDVLPIVSELACQYTGFESTSITYEKAESLMAAVLYCLNEYTHANMTLPAQEAVSVKEQYIIGRQLVAKKAEHIRELFNELSPYFEDYNVACLHDTVQKGIPEFLKRYDVKFCPQNTPVDLEYPVLTDCHSLSGADAMERYMQAIRTEQKFLSLFDRNYVISVLEKMNPDYRYTPENICSIMLTNTIGHAAIEKPLSEIGLQANEYSRLRSFFQRKTKPEITSFIHFMINTLTERFFEADVRMAEYLRCDAENISVRIEAAAQYDSLRQLFIL